MDKGLAIAMRKTLEYGKKYGAEYSREEIKERLISKKVFKVGKIKVELNQITKRKLSKATDLATDIGRVFKGVQLIGVTGSVAAGYPDEKSDIDLMIITKSNCLWWTRFWLRIYVRLKRIPHRKYGEPEKKDDFCFNLWLEDGWLTLPKSRQNLSNAMDLILMKPVYRTKNIYEKFISMNDWVSKFVATGYRRIRIRKIDDKTVGVGWVKAILNWLVYWPQWWYMKQKKNKELVSFRWAFFHPSRK